MSSKKKNELKIEMDAEKTLKYLESLDETKYSRSTGSLILRIKSGRTTYLMNFAILFNANPKGFLKESQESKIEMDAEKTLKYLESLDKTQYSGSTQGLLNRVRSGRASYLRSFIVFFNENPQAFLVE